MWKLRFHFVIYATFSEGAWIIYLLRRGDFGQVVLHFLRAILQSACFHLALKLRSVIGRLPDKDLDKFLVDTMLNGGLKTMFSILFLTFRVTKCSFEKEGGMEECPDTSFCAMMISSYLISWWGAKIVQGSVRSVWRKDLNLSIEKIATMRDISLRRGVAGFLSLVTFVCAIFLFSMMSAEEMDEMTITVVGYSGVVASGGALLSEVFSSLKAQKSRLTESGSSQITEQEEKIEEPVEEVSGEKFNYVTLALKF